MGANNASRENMRFFRIVGMANKADVAGRRAICEVTKGADGKYVASEWFNNITGWITKLEQKEFEWEGKKSKILVIQLTDSEGICQIECSLSGPSYSIINSLIGADLTREVEISAWIKDEKYVNAALKYADGEKCEWIIPTEDQPKPVEYKKPSGEMDKDFTNVKEFWCNQFLAISPKATRNNFTGVVASAPQAAAVEVEAPVNAPAPTQEATAAQESAPVATEAAVEVSAEEEDLDLPF
jgi:hypothetical protein